jgi:hypothetical protein
MFRPTVIALVTCALLAPSTSAQPVMRSRPNMSAAVAPLSLSSELQHPGDVLFDVSTGSGASATVLCADATLTASTPTTQVACGPVLPGSAITVTVEAADIDRCAGRTGSSLVSCQATYSSANCMASRARGSTSGCRYYGGIRPRTYTVTVPMVGPGTAVRLAWTRDGSAVVWR